MLQSRYPFFYPHNQNPDFGCTHKVGLQFIYLPLQDAVVAAENFIGLLETIFTRGLQFKS